ncbi:MAG: hypothetical protein GY755_21940 [Chloroflexi bacterium]|nr:hypothetical protein [Chloroflexota bacterium]
MAEYGLLVQIALTIVLILLGLWISVTFIRWLLRSLRVEADQLQTLKLANQGNAICQYHLSVKTTAPNLKFTLYSDDYPLAPVFEEIEEEVVEKQADMKEDKKKKTSISAANTSTESVIKTEKPKADADGALKAGKDVGVKSGVLANLLGTIGSILPGSLGSSMDGAAGQARNVQSKTAKAVQAPQSAQRKMDSMKSSGGRLGVKADAAPEPAGNARKVRGRKMPETREQNEFSRPARDVIKKIKRTVEKVGVVQTVDLGPGENFLLTLKISKEGKRYPVGIFGYSLESQPVPLDKKLGNAPMTMKKGSVHFDPIARWRYWVPGLSVIFYLLLLAMLSYYLFLFIWA